MQKTIVRDQDKLLLTRKLTLTSLFGALYAALVVIFAQYSVLPSQVRVADALLPLAILFGWPAAVGLALGALVGNLAADTFVYALPSGSIGIDMIAGSLVNLVAGLLAWKIGRIGLTIRGRTVSWFLGVTVETLLVGLVVGSYLSVILPGWTILVSIGLLLAGSIVSINFLGYSLLRSLGRPLTREIFRSKGLDVSE